MYGGKGAGSVIGKTVVAGVGVIALPNTGGNMLGTILAISAISIGVVALVSQLVVRVVRHKYQA